jgi:hypothetical protein
MKWLQLLSDRLREERSAAEQTLLSGRASDFADYRRLAGILFALHKAEEIAKDVSDQLMRE